MVCTVLVVWFPVGVEATFVVKTFSDVEMAASGVVEDLKGVDSAVVVGSFVDVVFSVVVLAVVSIDVGIVMVVDSVLFSG